MARNFFFYDLETSGFSPRRDRIMQFAGIRVDQDFRETGEEYNILIRLAEDILPEPTALMVTKITPQKTREDGVSEAEFVRIFSEKIATPDTIFVGYNNVRFDDEHMRHTLWRNFRDPYAWAWKDGRGRWDILDAGRLVRALRPEGIVWPFVEHDGEKFAANKLELISALNNFEHEHAHDALSDVRDTIELARLLREKQPKMFDFLLKIRDKNRVAELVGNGQPFVLASGSVPAENLKTSVFVKIADAKNNKILAFDLRVSPTKFAKLTEEELLENLSASWEKRQEKDFVALPIKEIALNKCPAVAPLGTLDAPSQKRINLSLADVKKHFLELEKSGDLVDKILAANAQKNDKMREKFAENSAARDVESMLYDSFTPPSDAAKIRAVAAADAGALADFHPDFDDARLPELLLRYKARNFPKSLSADEKQRYEAWRAAKLQREMPKYLREIGWLDEIARGEIPTKFADDDEKRAFEKLQKSLGEREVDASLLTDLQLWAESIAPYDE